MSQPMSEQGFIGNSFISGEGQADIPPHIVVDALLTIQRLLNLIDASDPEMLASFDRIAEVARSNGMDMSSAAGVAGEQLAFGHIVIMLHVYMMKWFEGGADRIEDLYEYLTLVDIDDDRDETKLFTAIVEALLAVRQIERAPAGAETRARCCQAFRALGALAEGRGGDDEAFAAYMSAANMVAAGEPDATGAYADSARLACRANRSIALCKARLALAHAAAAESNSAHWEEAFAAAESALRNLPPEGPGRDQVLSILQLLLRYPGLKALGPWYALTQRAPGLGVLADAMEGLSQFLALVCNADAKTYMDHALRLAKYVSLGEDERLCQAPNRAIATARTEWETWSFRHAAFLRAVPHGRSILRERDFDQLVLVLNHELTHVYSMGGHLGRAVMALRAAIVDHELGLWGQVEAGESLPKPEEIYARGVAMPEPGRAAALPFIERSLDASLKLRALQNTWAPWFEGIAVYAEHAADPTQDADAYCAPIPVLLQLVDEKLRASPSDSDELLRQRTREHYEKFEKLYSQAIERQGAYRLRTYLDRHHGHYLAGYLAVRRVVATWRRTLNRPLSGAQAARILLHCTQYGTAEAVPDLGLPLDEFRPALAAKLATWIDTVARISREDLEAILAPVSELREQGSFLEWSGGKLKRREHLGEGHFNEFLASTVELIEQAFTSLAGSRANPGRIEGIRENDLCWSMVEAAGEGLLRKVPNMRLARFTVTAHVRQLNMLVLGEVEAPMWLLPQMRAVACHIRTTEADAARGEAAYNGEVQVLSEEEYASLEKEVLRLRQTRMRVTRVADLVPGGASADERGFGRNYLVLQYGSWISIRPAGLATGTFVVPADVRADIEERLAASELSRLEREVLANGKAGARRSLDWLERSAEWRLGDERVPLQAWADHVKQLAEALLDPEANEEHEVATRMLLEFALPGCSQIAEIGKAGLRALASEASASLGACVRLLDASARLPVADGPLTEVGLQLPLLFERGPHGWDVAANA